MLYFELNLPVIQDHKFFKQALPFLPNRPEYCIPYLKVTALWSCTAIALLPAAFSQAHFDSGWNEGFQHPLTGWDHILCMVASGIWAAQIHEQAMWVLPVVFASVMSFGSLAEAFNLIIPGAEAMILLSCLIFSTLIMRGIRFDASINVAIIALFAFFHGYAHGQEISAPTSLVFYIAGFVFATLLLHSVGILISRLLLLTATFLVSTGLNAQGKDLPSPPHTAKSDAHVDKMAHTVLDEISVHGCADKLIGIAASASQGKVGQDQIRYRPMTRPGEILEYVYGSLSCDVCGYAHHHRQIHLHRYFFRKSRVLNRLRIRSKP